MTLVIVFFIAGIIVLRSMESSIGLILGTGLLIVSFMIGINTALDAPDEIPHKDKIAEVSKKTKQVIKHVKDEIDKEPLDNKKSPEKKPEKEEDIEWE